MQVYSQKSTSTTLPRSPAAVSGAEFTQRSGLNAGSLFAAPAKLEPTTMPAKMSGKVILMNGHPGSRHAADQKDVRVDDGHGKRRGVDRGSLVAQAARVTWRALLFVRVHRLPYSVKT